MCLSRSALAARIQNRWKQQPRRNGRFLCTSWLFSRFLCSVSSSSSHNVHCCCSIYLFELVCDGGKTLLLLYIHTRTRCYSGCGTRATETNFDCLEAFYTLLHSFSNCWKAFIPERSSVVRRWSNTTHRIVFYFSPTRETLFPIDTGRWILLHDKIERVENQRVTECRNRR